MRGFVPRRSAKSSSVRPDEKWIPTQPALASASVVRGEGVMNNLLYSENAASFTRPEHTDFE